MANDLETMPGSSSPRRPSGSNVGFNRRVFLEGLGAVLALSPFALGQESKEKGPKFITMKPPKDIAEKLKKVGDKETHEGKMRYEVPIGDQNYTIEVDTGDNGKIVWSMENVRDKQDKDRAVVVLRLERPDNNPSVMFKGGKPGPKIKELCLVKMPDLPERLIGTVYAGNKDPNDPDNVLPAAVPNAFSTDGSYGGKDRQIPNGSNIEYIAPQYSVKDATGKVVTTEGTAGFFASTNGAVSKGTESHEVGFVLDYTEFEKQDK